MFADVARDAITAAMRVAKRDGIGAVAKRSLVHVADFLRAQRFLRDARSLSATASPEQVVDLVLSNRAVRPLQIKTEIVSLAETLTDLRPQRLLEIGTAEGGTLFVFCRCAAPNARVISIDLPGGGPFGGGYRAWRNPLYRQFAVASQTVRLIRADSHSATTLERVKSELDGRQLDFLFIDGDHTYEGVKRDFEMYMPLVREGGLIAMHDIALPPLNVGYGVHRLWAEIRDHFHVEEFVEDPSQGAKGIGLVWI